MKLRSANKVCTPWPIIKWSRPRTSINTNAAVSFRVSHILVS